GDLGKPLGAAKAVGAVAQQRAHRGVVGDDEQPSGAQTKGEIGAVLARPALDLLMDARALELERVPDQRPTRRRRQLVDLAQSRGRGRRSSFGLDRHRLSLGSQCFAGDDTFWRISRPCSRSQSRFFWSWRLSCSALPLASAISALTRPPL